MHTQSLHYKSLMETLPGGRTKTKRQMDKERQLPMSCHVVWTNLANLIGIIRATDTG